MGAGLVSSLMQGWSSAWGGFAAQAAADTANLTIGLERLALNTPARSAPGYAMASTVRVAGDTNHFYINDRGAAALVMTLVAERRRDRLNATMGV